jgi:hypothetical protein
MKNLSALCQRCHMLHDRPHHLAQRWITYPRLEAGGAGWSEKGRRHRGEKRVGPAAVVEIE